MAALAWAVGDVYRMQSVLGLLLATLCFMQPRGDMEHTLLYAVDAYTNDMRRARQLTSGATWLTAAAWAASHWVGWMLV